MHSPSQLPSAPASRTARSASALPDPPGRRSVELGREGSERSDRQVGWLISLSGSALLLVQSPRLVADAEAAFSWWTLGASLIAIAVFCLAALGRVLPFRVLRAMWIGIPVLGCALWLLMCLAHPDRTEPATLWAWTLQPFIVSYPVLWMRPAFAIGMTAFSALLPATSALVFLGSVPHHIVVMTPVLLTNVAYLAIFSGMRMRLRQLRFVEREASEQYRLGTAAAAEAERQRRLRHLIHDHLLSVLTAAMTLDGAPPAALKSEAREALRMFEASRLTPTETALASHEPGLPSAEDALSMLTEAARRIDPHCALRAGATSGRLPRAALDALADAMGEALRNSLKHAGPGSSRSVEIVIDTHGVRVVVRDEGVGFDLDRIEPTRLGVRESLLLRMLALEGGSADVRSTPGRGTEVELTWRM